MHKRITLLAAAIAVAVLGVGVSAASAATLYTTAAHTSAVPVGTAFTASIPVGVLWNELYAGTPFEQCSQNNLSFTVTQNSAGVFKANNTSSTFSGCTPSGQSAAFGGTLQITAGSVANGTNTAWLGTTLNGMNWSQSGFGSWNANYTSATGSPPANGIFAQQPTAAKVPVSLKLDKAGPITGPIASVVTTTYTLTGTAAAYSLG